MAKAPAAADPFAEAEQDDPFAKAEGLFDKAQTNFEKIADYEDRLLLVFATGQTFGVETEYGPQDPIQADVVVLDGEEAPKQIDGMMIFQRVLIGQLKGKINKRPVLGVLTKKPGQKGRDAWILDSNVVTTEQVAVATKYLMANATDKAENPA